MWAPGVNGTQARVDSWISATRKPNVRLREDVPRFRIGGVLFGKLKVYFPFPES